MSKHTDIDALIAEARNRGDALLTLFPDDGDIRDDARLFETLAEALEATLAELRAALSRAEETIEKVRDIVTHDGAGQDWRIRRALTEYDKVEPTDAQVVKRVAEQAAQAEIQEAVAERDELRTKAEARTRPVPRFAEREERARAAWEFFTRSDREMSHDFRGGYHQGVIDEARPQARPQITDAQLLAALNAYNPPESAAPDLTYWHSGHQADMRRALEAALGGES